MPRIFRIKDGGFIYHIMFRSISEVPLFKNDEDKRKYMALVKKYQKKFGFKVYGFCLMGNHGHLIIDANGADISKIMKGINQSYAQYYNFKHKRHGHLFQDRFKSKVIYNKTYLFNVSAYIHNNPTVIEGFETCPENFEFSSLSYFLGLKEDSFEIIDEEFIMEFFDKNIKKAREKYYKFVMKCDEEWMKAHIEFQDEEGEYRSERTVLVRDFKPEEVEKFIKEYTNIEEKMLKWKYRRDALEPRALCVFLIRYYCDFSYKQIGGVLGRLTLSRIAQLANIGLEIIEKQEKYRNIMDDFVKWKEVAL